MGDNEMAVVDDRLYGLNSFRIVDVSIMPCITTENTNAPIIAIAEKEANLLKEFQ